MWGNLRLHLEFSPGWGIVVFAVSSPTRGDSREQAPRIARRTCRSGWHRQVLVVAVAVSVVRRQWTSPSRVISTACVDNHERLCGEPLTRTIRKGAGRPAPN